NEDEDVRGRFLEAVDPRFRGHILGSTDSEVLFYLFMSRLARRVDDIYHEGIRQQVEGDVVREHIEVTLQLAPEPRAEEPNRLNLLVTNGSVMVGTCFKRTLYFSTYKTQCPESASCAAYEPYRCESEVRDGIVKHLIVSSEEVRGSNVW